MPEKIVIDPALLKTLSDLKGYTLLCDSTGKTLGIFQPVQEQIRGTDINLECPISEQELQRRRQVKTGKTTEEILERLGL
jgi:hypothetical protein